MKADSDKHGLARRTEKAQTVSSGTRIRVLILEDVKADAELMVAGLTKSGFLPEWHRVETAGELVARLTPDLDVILSDFSLPTINALDALRLVRSHDLDIPFIVVSGSVGEDSAVQAIHKGADDYVLKDRLRRLGPAVRQAIEKRRLRQEKERAESTLRENESLYRSIFEDAAEGILLWSSSGYLLAANPALAAMLGYASADEMLSSMTNPGQRFFADPAARRLFMERVKREGSLHGYETGAIRKDGTTLWVSLSARLLSNQQDSALRILTMISDVGERKRTEEIRAHLAAIVENSSDAIIGRKLDGTITSWNASAERLLGYSANEAIGQSFAVLIPQGQHPRTSEINEKLARGESIPPHETKRKAKDGRVLNLLSTISPIKDPAGEIIGASQILKDISPLKRAEEFRALLAAVVNSSDDAIITRALDGTILSWNRGAERMFGYTAAGMVGQNVALIAPKDMRERSQANTEALLRGEAVAPYETERVAKDGRNVHVQIAVSAVLDSAGRTVAISAILRDITSWVLSTRRRAMEHAVTKVLAEAQGMDAAMPALIATICETMNWAYGARWAWNAEEQRLCRSEYWSDFEPRFEESDADYWLRLGTGGPGGLLRRAWLAKETTWLSDVQEDKSFRRKRSCMKFGLHSAYCFPILTGDSVLGVMEFFGREVREPDNALLQITESIGRQIGQFIQRRQAESALLASEERFRAAFEQAGVGMAIRDIEPLESRWLRVNQKLCDILGYTAEELLTLSSLDITPPEDRDIAVEYNEKLLRGEITSYSREKRYVRKDGQRIWAHITLTGVSGADGRRTHVISVIQDITDRKQAEAALRDSESRFRSFMRHLPGRASMRDSEGRYAFVNETWLDAFGMTEAAVLGRTPEELLPMERAAAVRSIHDEALKSGEPITRMFSLEFDGAPRWWLATHFPIADAEGRRVMAGTISIDVTEQKVREEKIEKLSRVRTVLGEVNAAIVRAREGQALLQETCRIVCEQGGIDMVWIGTINSDKQEVRPVAWTGFSADAAHAVNWESLGAPGVTISEVMRTRRLAVRSDIEADQSIGILQQEAVKKGFRSTVCLPFVVDEQVVAAMILFAAGRDFFIEDELALLNELAGDVSFALGHIAKQQKIERLSRTRAVSSSINSILVRVRNRPELLQQSCRVAVEDGQFPLAWIGILDPMTQDVTPVAWSGEHAEELTRTKSSARDDTPRGMGTVGLAIRERRAVVNNDVAARHFAGARIQDILRLGFRSQITLPLFEEKSVIGTLTMYAREAGFFDEEEISLLTEVAGDISFALEHIARQERIDRLSRVRAVLGEINTAIVRLRSREELFDEVCRIVVEAGRFPSAWLGVFDRAAQHVTPVAWAGADTEYLSNVQVPRPVDDRRPGGLCLVAMAVLEKQAVIVNDVENDTRVARKQIHLDRGTHSIAVLPLLVNDEVTGIIALHAHEVGFFDEEEVKLLFELANDISFALQTIEKQEKLDYLSYYDPLTGLPNRALFTDRIGQQMRSRAGEPLMTAVVLLNLERFRNINETFGRSGGDELLKEVAGRLEAALGSKDSLARVGGDVFGVVMRGIRDAAAFVHVVESQILNCFRTPFHVRESEVRISAKSGIAMFPPDGSDPDNLYNNAEAALKKARYTGEEYLFYAAEMNARVAQAVSLENRLRKAVEKQEFLLHYQPKYNLATNKVCGFEALLRWQEPGAGLVSPGDFIPILEETGLILQVGKWAISQALAEHEGWKSRGRALPRVAVNVSAIQLQRADFAEMVMMAVQDAGATPDALELEITESLLMRDIESSISKLAILHKNGVQIAMDDFGTGYSSLSYLARLPINCIKIDRSFIKNVANSPQDMAIVTTIIALAHSLNLAVVAEGVETIEQARLLSLLKCDEGQGYLYSKPVPPSDIGPFLA